MGAWIETYLVSSFWYLFWSHPLWVRGLKPNVRNVFDAMLEVAPFMGAWIETVPDEAYIIARQSRTLYGCVD